MDPLIHDAGLDLDHIAKYTVPDTPPWQLEQPKVIFDLSQHTKATTDPSIFKSLFLEVKDRYSTYTPLFTDGSKDGDRVAAAASVPEGDLQSRLPDKSSIFSAELRAILLALDFAEISWRKQFILFSDSLSSLQALYNMKLEHPLIRQVIELHHLLLSSGKDIIFCWLPSHTGIKGNDRADSAAKTALELPTSNFPVCYHDFKSSINSFISDTMQTRWDLLTDNKLHAVKPTLGEWTPGYRRVRGMKLSLVGYALDIHD